MSMGQGEDFYPLNNFFDDEDFSAEPPSEELLDSIKRVVLEIFFMLPILDPEEEMAVGKLFMADCLGSVVLMPDLNSEHKNKHWLEIFKIESEKHMQENCFASFVIQPPKEQDRLVVFDIFVEKVSRKFKENYPEFESGSEDTSEELFNEALKYQEKIYEKEKVSGAIAEELGLDFVSKRTAIRILQIIRQYKRHLERYLKTPS